MGLQKIVVLCVAAALVAGGVWYMLRSEEDTQPVTQVDSRNSTEETESKNKGVGAISGVGSFMDLMTRGEAIVCEYSVHDESGTMQGTSYFEGIGERYRMDGTGIWDGQSGEFGAVVDGESMYWWSVSANGAFGMKVPISEAESETTVNADFDDTAQPFAEDQEVTYDCQPWRVDASVFTPPSDIEFTDMTEMMRQMMSGHDLPDGFEMPAGMMVTP